MPRKGWQERFWEKIVLRPADLPAVGPHWLWTRSRNSGGYGQFWVDGKLRKAHIVAWELIVGPVPAEGLHNRCGVHHCCNPNHWIKRRREEARHA